jgi:eukaryotic-like serine/threonine-protein kinase
VTVEQDTLHGQVSEYRLYESIASGGFGSVYIGRDTATNVPVAVKRLHPHLKSEPGFVERFEQEAATVRGLTHPNIVRLLDQGRDQLDVPFIVMEWVEGLTIGDWLKRRGRYAPSEAATVGCQVLEGLDAAWARRVVHRDIKPANLIVTPGGRVKIMDFGVAKDVDLATVAGSSGLIGTPAYMAPEQLRGQALDCRADLYALGITLYMMIAGRPPFEGPSFADYFRQHLEQNPPPLDGVDPGLAGVIQRALAKLPEERYSTPAEMLMALRPYAGEGTPPIPPTLPDDATVVSRRTPPPTRAAAATPATVMAQPSAQNVGATVAVRPATAAGRQIAPWMIAAPLIALVLIGAVVAFVLSRPSPVSTPSPALQTVVAQVATSTPAVVANTGTPQAASATLLQDPLTDLATGKLPRSSPSPSNFFVSYGADGYVMQKLIASYAQPITVNVPGSFGDSVVALDARLVDPVPASGFIDLGCRDQSPTPGRYDMTVTPQSGDVSIWKTDSLQQTVLAKPANAAGVLKHDGTPDHLEFVCKGASLTARVNGNDVVSATDSAYKQGALVIGAGAPNANVEAHFKNLVVSQP